MEKKNDFLQEGYFPLSEFSEDFEAANALESLKMFLKHSAIKLKDYDSVNLFKESTIDTLFENINSAIDDAEHETAVENNTLRTTSERAIEILNSHNEFIVELSQYFNKFYGDSLFPDDSERIDGFINYMPFSRKMSSGEISLLNFYSSLYDFLTSNLIESTFRKPKEHYVLLLDEADLSFHITWKKRYVKALLHSIPHFFDEIDKFPNVQIIFTTHDPLALSDIPNANVIYIERPSYDSHPNILQYNSKIRPAKTFGANISDLIADSFFSEKSLIGDFAYDKISEAITWLNQKQSFRNQKYYESLIKIIDEPIVQRKLAEMFDEKLSSNFQMEIIDHQIRMLEELKNKLK